MSRIVVILQLSLSGYVNVNTIRTTATVQANSAVEYTDIAMVSTDSHVRAFVSCKLLTEYSIVTVVSSVAKRQ